MFEDNDPLISYHSSLSLTARYLPRLYLQPGAHIRHPHLAGLDQLLHEPRDLRLLQQRLQEVKKEINQSADSDLLLGQLTNNFLRRYF